ncbi:high-affinity iron permease, partial [Cladochytrium tenue]
MPAAMEAASADQDAGALPTPAAFTMRLMPSFNPAALFICFRESLEAVIIVVVLLQFLNKTLALEPEDSGVDADSADTAGESSHTDSLDGSEPASGLQRRRHRNARLQLLRDETVMSPSPEPVIAADDVDGDAYGRTTGPTRLHRLVHAHQPASGATLPIGAWPDPEYDTDSSDSDSDSDPVAAASSERRPLLVGRHGLRNQRPPLPTPPALPAASQRQLLMRLRRHVWIGALAGLAVAVLVGLGLIFALWYFKSDILVGRAGELSEAGFELFAVVLQTFLAVKLITYTAKHGASSSSAMTAKWQKKIDRHMVHAAEQAGVVGTTSSQSAAAVDDGDDLEDRASSFEYPFVILAFTVVLREGLESVIYLTGISAGEHPSALALPGLLGILSAILVGVAIHRFSAAVPLGALMQVSVTMMLVLSAGLLSSVAAEVEEAVYEDLLGIDDGSTPVLWDLKFCCDENSVPAFQVLSALIGWRARPTVATFGSWLVYWAVVAALVLPGHARASRDSAAAAAKLVDEEAALAAAGSDASPTPDLVFVDVAEDTD